MQRRNANRSLALSLIVATTGWLQISGCAPRAAPPASPAAAPARTAPRTKAEIVADAAWAQVGRTLYYDPAYVRLGYPGGDVPLERGVCSDVVVRAFRTAGVDLQKEMHQDMRRAFSAYPRLWGLRRPDPNIDHRRVANLQTFFRRQGKALPVTRDARQYRPGDVVAWVLDNGRLHIGIVSGNAGAGGRPPIVHNIGAGTQEEDVLFGWKVIGHYRYFGG